MDPMFQRGERLLYYDRRHDKFLEAQIEKVHRDDAPNWYYTISVNGNVRVTDEGRLTRAGGRRGVSIGEKSPSQDYIQTALDSAVDGLANATEGIRKLARKLSSLPEEDGAQVRTVEPKRVSDPVPFPSTHGPPRTQSQAHTYESLEERTQATMERADAVLEELIKIRDELVCLECDVETASNLREADRAALKKLVGSTLKGVEKPHFGN
eukprot:m.25761 g.25761  ORF g.25761 m.25761 type:complete len:210 (+) comp7737_c0_seq2:256-885(+)